MLKPRKPVQIPPLTAKEAQDLVKRIEETTIEFRGNFEELRVKGVSLRFPPSVKSVPR
jgi:hypothetical protein